MHTVRIGLSGALCRVLRGIVQNVVIGLGRSILCKDIYIYIYIHRHDVQRERERERERGRGDREREGERVGDVSCSSPIYLGTVRA